MGRNPLKALQSTTTLTYYVPKPGAVNQRVVGVETYEGFDNLDRLTYSIYLTGVTRNPFEFMGIDTAEVPLMGFLLDPLYLDNRIAIGTQVPGRYQNTTGMFKRVFCDVGLPIVSKIIGERVAFIFTAQSIEFDTIVDCNS